MCKLQCVGMVSESKALRRFWEPRKLMMSKALQGFWEPWNGIESVATAPEAMKRCSKRCNGSGIYETVSKVLQRFWES